MINRWLVEDPDSDVYEEFDTEAEAVTRALECINEYRKNAHGEWPDSVDHIRILQVAYMTREVEVEGGVNCVEFSLADGFCDEDGCFEPYCEACFGKAKFQCDECGFRTDAAEEFDGKCGMSGCCGSLVLRDALEARTLAPKVVRIIFDGPPSHESGRFVECEDEQGRGIKAGEWKDLENGLWELRIEVSNASI